MSSEDGLPTFAIKPSGDNDPYKKVVYLTQNYRDAEPRYIKERSKHPDEYATSLLDAHYPDILYAQALAKPSISTPSLSTEEIKRQRNGGSPILPNITLPTQFTIQLYNPESQVIVKQGHSKFSGNYWEFTMPVKSFRQPTGSQLDQTLYRSSALPPSGVSTFRWKRDGGVVSRASLRCFLLSTASSASGDSKARKRGGSEPDIPLATMEKLRDITIYEPNLKRVDVEDRKGLELVLVLSAAVIAEIYYSPPATTFNVAPQSAISHSPSSPVSPISPVSIPQFPIQPPLPITSTTQPPPPRRTSNNTLTKTPTPPTSVSTVVNTAVHAETSRPHHQQAKLDRARKRAEEAETARLQKLVASEERHQRDLQRRQQAAVDAETARLRKQYAKETQAWETLQETQQHQAFSYYQQRLQDQQANRRQSVPQPSQRTQLQQARASRPPVLGSDGGYGYGYTQSYGPPASTGSAYAQTSSQHVQLPPQQQQQPQSLGHKKSSSVLKLFGGGNKNNQTLTVQTGTTGRLGKKKSSLW